MGLLIGTDEAGYGPNLGPLVVAATIWRTSEAAGCHDLYEQLDDIVCRKPLSGTRQDQRLAVADSKQLYRPGSDWGHLERAVLAALALTGKPVSSWTNVWPAVAPDRDMVFPALPWHTGFELALPRDIATSDVDWWQMRLGEALPAREVELVGVLARVVFPEEFNRRVDAVGSKGTLLSEVTLELIKKCGEWGIGELVTIRCDKHGGRSRYGPLLQATFPEYLIEVVREGRAQSVYRWGPANERVDIRFVAGGEQFLPTALASMTAKYARELLMLRLNRFFMSHLPDLAPTAGYVQDGRRYLREIEPVIETTGITVQDLVRSC